MKDWKQRIADLLRDRCRHGPDGIIGPGCPDCQDVYRRVLKVIDEGLVDLQEEIRTSGVPAYTAIEDFRRSIPTVR